MGKLIRSKGATAAAAVVSALTVLDELAKAASITRKKDEEMGAYVERICEGCGKLSDDEFGKLSKGAQDYFNAAVEAINNGKALPEPAKLKGAKAAEPTPATPAAAAESPKPEKGASKESKNVKKKAAAKPAATKPEVKKAAAKPAKKAKGKSPAKKPAAKAVEKSPRSEGVAAKMRNAVVAAKGDIEYEAALKKAGVDDTPHAYSLYAEAVELMALKKSAKARKEAADSGVIGKHLRAVVCENPKIEFEAACKAVGAKAKEAKAGSYLWNRWNQSRQLYALV